MCGFCFHWFLLFSLRTVLQAFMLSKTVQLFRGPERVVVSRDSSLYRRLEPYSEPKSVKDNIFNGEIPPMLRFNWKSPRFFGRSRELYQVWKILMENFDRSNEERILLVACQPSGCGKTMLGERLSLQRPMQNESVTELFDTLPDSIAKSEFRDALYIRVDLRAVLVDDYLELVKPTKRVPSVSGFIYYLIWRSFYIQSFGRESYEYNLEKFENEFFSKIHTFDELLSAMQIICKRPLFLHFDELGAIDGWTQLQRNNETILHVFYDFWRCLVRFMDSEVFIFTSGRSTNMYLVGKGPLHSGQIAPSRVQRVYLKPFEADDIKDILVSHEPKLALNMTHTSQMAEWLHGLTSGIPRMVFEGIRFLLQQSNSLLSFQFSPDLQHLDHISKDMLDYFILNTFPRKTKLNLPKKLEKVYDTMMLYVAKEMDVSVNERIGEFSIGELIDYFGIYATASEKNTVGGSKLTLICPLLWRRVVDTYEGQQTLLHQSSKVDKGKMLEDAVISALTLTDLRKRCIADYIPVLKNWAYGKTHVAPVLYLSLDMRVNSEHGEGQAISFQKHLKNHLKSDESVLLTFFDRSSSPDLMVVASVNNHTNLVVGLQCKNLNPTDQSDAVGKTTLFKDAEKFIKTREMIPDKTPGIFVIVSMGCYAIDLEPYVGTVVNAKKLFEGLKPPKDLLRKMDFDILLLGPKETSAFLQETDSEAIRNFWKEHNALKKKPPTSINRKTEESI
jgi:hypothetical protein